MHGAWGHMQVSIGPGRHSPYRRVMTTASQNPPLRAAIVPVTPLQQNCSIVWCTATMKAAVVDPGGDLPRIHDAIAKTGVTVEKILLTHGHIDHAGGAKALADALSVPVEGRRKRIVSGWRGWMKTVRPMVFRRRCWSRRAGCPKATR